MNAKDLLRVQAISFADIQLENQGGPVDRHLLEVAVSQLFPENRQEEARWLRLVVDKTQLALLRDQILALDDLPGSPGIEPPAYQ